MLRASRCLLLHLLLSLSNIGSLVQATLILIFTICTGPALDRCPRCSRTGPPGTRGLLPVYMCIYIGNSLSYSSPKAKTKSPLISIFTMQAYTSRGSLPSPNDDSVIGLLLACFLPSRGSIQASGDQGRPDDDSAACLLLEASR
jgi:hypothetical protein